LVVATQRRATVAADETGGVFALQRITLPLQHGQTNQGLHPTHESLATLKGVFVVEGDALERAQEVLRQRGVHEVVSSVCRPVL
jgi:hypothetical protein